MESIASLAEMVHEELEGAKCYAKLALEYRDREDTSAARQFAEMANQELGHADRLRSMALGIANSARSAGNVPSGMEQLWDYENGRIIDETAEVRNLLGMYNG